MKPSDVRLTGEVWDLKNPIGANDNIEVALYFSSLTLKYKFDDVPRVMNRLAREYGLTVLGGKDGRVESSRGRIEGTLSLDDAKKLAAEAVGLTAVSDGEVLGPIIHWTGNRNAIISLGLYNVSAEELAKLQRKRAMAELSDSVARITA